MDSILELQQVTKAFKGKTVLENVSFSISSGEVTAIIGSNGSGKSTLLKIMSGLEKPDSGQIVYAKGQAFRIGYVPEMTPSSLPFTLTEYLTFMGMIRKMPKERLNRRIGTLVQWFHMEEHRHTRIGQFSKGMKQKVMIMQALLEEADLLIMDEPLSGLDAKAQTELEELLQSLKEGKIGIVLTCHETKLLKNVVDRMIVISSGEVTFTDSSERYESMYRIVFELEDRAALHSLEKVVSVREEKEIGTGRTMLELNVVQEYTDQVVRKLMEQGASIKFLAPLNEREAEFLQHFNGEGE